MKYELMLLKILGLRLNPIMTKENKYDVIDNEENVVGSIEKKRIFKKNNRRGLDALYCYTTNIDNGKIKVNHTRKERENNTREPNYSYEFNNNVEGGENKINLILGKSGRLTICSEKHGFMDLLLENNKFYFTCPRKHETLNVVDSLSVNINNFCSKYKYSVSFCNKKYSLEDDIDKAKVYVLSVACDNNENLDIIEWYWKNNVTTEQTRCQGTIEDVIKNNDIALEAFNNYKNIANQLLPYDGDIFELIFEKSGASAKVAPFFYQQEEKNITNSQLLKRRK